MNAIENLSQIIDVCTIFDHTLVHFFCTAFSMRNEKRVEIDYLESYNNHKWYISVTLSWFDPTTLITSSLK